MFNAFVHVLLQPVNLGFFAAMLVLALIDVWTYFWRAGAHHRNFKGEIVGLGILGTFFGIFLGLQTFDPSHIQESIPPLLDGLKTAFLTSIAGMSISMVLTVLQALVRTRAALRADDPVQALLQDVLAATREAHEREAKDSATLIEQVRNARMEQRDESLKTREVFEQSFATMNASLEAALEKLSEGASAKIIEALEQVIRDFNQNLTEQFGENFKQLNAACLKLVEWQDNYRASIEQMERTLREAVTAIDETEASLAAIAKRNEEFSQLCTRLGDTISTSDRQAQQLNANLVKQAELASQASAGLAGAQSELSKLGEHFRSATELGVKTFVGALSQSDQRMAETQTRFAQTTQDITAGFARMETEHRTQMAGISKTLTEHCNTITSGLRESKQGLDELAATMQGSLNTQSQTLTELTKRTAEVTEKTRNELAEALRQMNSALTSLTTQFGQRYREFLAAVERLMPQ